MEIDTLLNKLGFSDNKAKIYQAILSLGSAPASTIAQKAGIVRSTTYKILEELASDGLVEMTDQGVKKFTALHPKALITLQENKKSTLERLLPELLGIYSSPKFKPKMRFYEGEEGKKKVFEDILSLHNDIVYTFSPIEQVLSIFGKIYSRHFMEKRTKNKIWRHALRPAIDINKNTGEWEFYGSDEKLMRQVRFLPPKIKCDTLIQIYANKVAVIASKKEDYAFIIESKELAELMKQIFLWLWHTSPKP
ncbi:MAG TPA: hypothetical protein DHS36_00310 [Candidatus Veblenbacteria bacterium]|uniref:Transcription regulator TrmB N-terminal domain-containing protein n=2 Tax=Candidatus Vebleniibacteriota TaxID=1817921 RepID=A0A1G2Q8R6_9BACT|nr:MAG: hypothetical protein A2588_01575 [Candidatus Veblenbacteria bacterium RIFOXYD1_FULL_43_11]OHA57334.1 MAG: hypothetical protein A2441_00770 [Candidatus Veblenbacteria bacterium RIFOXYC2_FULL_42_11]HAO81363.1 hypothetical protein [Candidatus Veblenbacteria bacterium]HCX38703.1 hypothetical protein [Candidatus Veblenbacteria bacterium]